MLGSTTFSGRAPLVLAIGAVLLCAIVSWFIVVSPKRSEANRLEGEVATAETQLTQTRLASSKPASARGEVSDLFRLAKAMPASDDQPGLLLELDRLTRATRLTLGTITLQEPVVTVGGATMIPVAVTVGGSYGDITRFLVRMRRLVTVRTGQVRATGRLFAVQSVELTESKSRGFPSLDGSILLNAFVYDGPVAAPVVAPPAGDETNADSNSSAARATP